ncbi:MAG: hypothetical protein SFV54_04940 [Bryobacteraceae bacterium]|nr:hypothetical protein [Bryobacteraceae bacterium]
MRAKRMRIDHLLALAGLILFPGGAYAERIHLLLIPEAAAHSEVLAAFERESRRLFESVGIEVGLHIAPGLVRTASGGHVVSLYWQGNCADFRDTPPGRGGKALAAVQAEGSLIRPVVRLECDRVAELLGRRSKTHTKDFAHFCAASRYSQGVESKPTRRSHRDPRRKLG